MGKNNPETKRAWEAKNREKILAQQRERRRKNPERTKRHLAKYKSENSEKIKEINKIWQQNNKDRVRKNARAWRAKNKDKVKARTRKWRLENPEKMQAHRDKWLEENREYKKQKEAEWRAFNIDHNSVKNRKRYRAKKEHILGITKKWQKANPHAMKQIGARRRARLKGATVGDTKAIAAWEKEWRSKESVECAYCHQSFPPADCDTDHVIPLTKGGPHELGNLAVSCWWCNRSKHNRTLEEWNAVKLEHPTSACPTTSQSAPQRSACHPANRPPA